MVYLHNTICAFAYTRVCTPHVQNANTMYFHNTPVGPRVLFPSRGQKIWIQQQGDSLCRRARQSPHGVGGLQREDRSGSVHGGRAKDSGRGRTTCGHLSLQVNFKIPHTSGGSFVGAATIEVASTTFRASPVQE